ncbi:MAG TPA: VOC family protein [Caulobacteraceae bacterium]|jgi:catechol 2,3-dioxygenase-like lactoylglutathione lyase family enzyme
MLANENLMAFISTSQPAAARQFYEGVLGLTFLIDDPHLLVFGSGDARVMIQKSDQPVVPPHGTAMGWHVADLRATVQALMARGVAFERGELPQDDLGIWSPAPGHGVAWFFDPDGNRLSVSN